MEEHSTRGGAYFLEELLGTWGVGFPELRRWFAEGRLRAHVWLPVMSVHRVLEASEGSGIELCHWEGYAVLSPCCCYRLFRRGKVSLRELVCGRSGERYALPGRAEDVVVEIGDLVVLEGERARFEETGAVEPSTEATAIANLGQDSEGFRADRSFKVLRYRGGEYRLGDLQAAVLRELYEQAKKGEPWQSGKQILARVGSQSYSLSNLFKRNPVWRDLVQSDGRGAYRLRTDRILASPD